MKGHEGGSVNPATHWDHPNSAPLHSPKPSGVGPWHPYDLSSVGDSTVGPALRVGKKELEGRLGLALQPLTVVAVPRIFDVKPRNLILTY